MDPIEAAAHAVFDEHCARLGLRRMPWHQMEDSHKAEFIAYAKASLAAYRDAFKAEYTDHAALLRAVAEEARKLRHAEGCHSFVYPNTNATTPHAPRFVVGRLDESKCNCPRGKVLAMLEVEK